MGRRRAQHLSQSQILLDPAYCSADQAHSTMKLGRTRVMNLEQDRSRFFTKGRVRRRTKRRIQHLHQEGILTEGPFQKSGHQTQAVCLPEGLAKEKLTQWTKHQTRAFTPYAWRNGPRNRLRRVPNVAQESSDNGSTARRTSVHPPKYKNFEFL